MVLHPPFKLKPVASAVRSIVKDTKYCCSLIRAMYSFLNTLQKILIPTVLAFAKTFPITKLLIAIIDCIFELNAALTSREQTKRKKLKTTSFLFISLGLVTIGVLAPVAATAASVSAAAFDTVDCVSNLLEDVDLSSCIPVALTRLTAPKVLGSVRPINKKIESTLLSTVALAGTLCCLSPSVIGIGCGLMLLAATCKAIRYFNERKNKGTEH